MPISNEFVCPNKHSFKAVAKLRARCPDCGMMARREFVEGKPSSTEKTTSKRLSHSTTSTSQSSTPTSGKEEIQTSSEDGSANALDSKKKFVKPKPVEKSRPTIIRRGKMPQPEKKKFIVKRKSAPSRTVIAVKKSPSGSRERKVVETLQKDESYWVGVKRKYFR